MEFSSSPRCERREMRAILATLSSKNMATSQALNQISVLVVGGAQVHAQLPQCDSQVAPPQIKHEKYTHGYSNTRHDPYRKHIYVCMYVSMYIYVCIYRVLRCGSSSLGVGCSYKLYLQTGLLPEFPPSGVLVSYLADPPYGDPPPFPSSLSSSTLIVSYSSCSFRVFFFNASRSRRSCSSWHVVKKRQGE